MSCSRTCSTRRRYVSNPGPLAPESDTLPLSHRAPLLFTCVVFILCCLSCMCPFPILCLGQGCYLIVSVPDHYLFIYFILCYMYLQNKLRPVARQGSSPEMRFPFLKHFRILYPFILNTIQINQRLCNNWHWQDLTQKNSKSVTLITGIGMVLHKILDKALSSCHNWIKSIDSFAKKLKL